LDALLPLHPIDRSEPPQSVTVPRITTLLMDPSTGAGSMMCALGGT
jgi:hypothetical protein